MEWVFLEIKERILLSPSQPPFFPTPPPPSNLESSGFNLNNKVSPSILLIIVILAIIFFISGVLHLFVRFLMRTPNRNPDELDNVTALQGQLQQLFDLHDAGVDQSFIDTLPVFNYNAIIGVKNPFDCAVCLCEFEGEDKLRLLPKCSHAFHMECIDTWLLSHSTCPLCRASLIPDFSANNSSSPIVLVLESGSESSREIFPERDSNSILRENSHMGFHRDDEIDDFSHEIEEKEEENQKEKVGSEGKVVAVKLGKFKNVDDGGGGEGSSVVSSNNVNGRRCFSMGSFAYVMDENSSLQVPIRTPMKKQSSKNKPSLPLTPGHRAVMSECGGDSRREFIGFETYRSIHNSGSVDCGTNDIGGGAIGRSKRESFSISKIWLRGKNEKPNPAAEVSRRAFSFRFPVHRNVVAPDELKPKNGGGNSGRRSGGDIEIGNWGENGGSEFGFAEEIHSSNSLDSQANRPSFARRTLLWLMGRQNKVVHSSFSNNL
ncbi:hypothetical protein LguiB_024320 [Lonicera macranthoides]